MPRLFALTVSILLASSPAHAELIDLRNGMVYDTVQNLTWLQDTHYARTSGYDDDGWLSQPEAITWADNLSFGGFTDWRLPLFNAGSDLDNSSEISTLLTQLGWHWPAWGDVEAGEVGPFQHLLDTPWPAVPMYWLGNATATIWNEVYVYDVRDGGVDRPAGAWAVREGNPTARVPEPSTLMILGIGAVAAHRLRRRYAPA